MVYNIHDKQVLDILKENNIKFTRDGHWSHFEVSYVFDHGKAAHLKGGSLVRYGAGLHVHTGSRWSDHLSDEELSRLPGRYIDVYPLTGEARVALQKNGYDVTFVASENNRKYFEVNTFIPQGQISKLPDGTLLLYEESGSIILYHK